MIRLLLIFSIVAMTSCKGDSQGPEISLDFDRSGEIVQVKVITYDNYADLNDAYLKHCKSRQKSCNEKAKLGWAGWSLNAPYQCEIHVIELSHVRDHMLTTWGHELGHCIYGAYHGE